MRLAVLFLLVLCLPVSAEEMTGSQVYEKVCIACHGKGLHGAPVFGDRQRWKKLIREELDELVPTALTGIRKMPAKGGNPALTDGEVARAVVHMANAGGGRFAEPGAAEISRWRQKADKRQKK